MLHLGCLRGFSIRLRTYVINLWENGIILVIHQQYGISFDLFIPVYGLNTWTGRTHLFRRKPNLTNNYIWQKTCPTAIFQKLWIFVFWLIPKSIGAFWNCKKQLLECIEKSTFIHVTVTHCFPLRRIIRPVVVENRNKYSSSIRFYLYFDDFPT